MKTSELIEKLTKESQPVRRIHAPFVAFLRWLLVAGFCLGVGIALFGPRADFEEVFRKNGFTLQIVSGIGLALMSALSAFVLSVPDRPKGWVSALPVFTLSLWLLSISINFYYVDFSPVELGFACVRDVAVLSILPSVFLFIMLKASAPLQKGRVGFLAMLSTAALGAVGTQFICHNDDPAHVLLWHFLPVLLIGSLGFWLGRRFLIWDR
jgi:hypothetical protein